jgi:malate synthase
MQQAQRTTNELFSVQLGNRLTSHPNAWSHQAERLLPYELLKIVSKLHTQFNQRRLDLLKARMVRQARYDEGETPDYLPEGSLPHHGDWKVAAIPQDLLKRRVEITGPVNSAKMVINMLNPNSDGIRADMAMLDFEDSMKPSWQNVLDGIENVKLAIEGNLKFFDAKKDKLYQLNQQNHAKVMVRIRGLHLEESNIQFEGQNISAGLLDFVATLFHTGKLQLEKGQTPKYYVPKIEDYTEAQYWNDLFVETQKLLDIEPGSIRATFLIETLPAAFQMEEILYELKDHIAGLNVGRWDKIFSDIKVLRNHDDKIMEDRSTIDMSKPWMKNYASRLIKICHTHGAMAIGGMSAFTPGKSFEQRLIQTQKVVQDKNNEATLGHDGCWVSHPYFIKPALEQFKQDNQLDVLLEDFTKHPNLIPFSFGLRTIQGLRKNVRVGIAYQKGWNEDVGCVSWDDMMEDLATLEISRAQTWQWMKQEVELSGGEVVSKELIGVIFDQELEKINKELETFYEGKELAYQLNLFKQAKIDAEDLFTQTEFSDFLSLASDLAK